MPNWKNLKHQHISLILSGHKQQDAVAAAEAKRHALEAELAEQAHHQKVAYEGQQRKFCDNICQNIE